MAPALSPLEFRECAVDGPNFRKALAKHEEELKYANKKTGIVYDNVKRVFKAMENLNTVLTELAQSLDEFSFSGAADASSHKSAKIIYEDSIDLDQTEDDIKISSALHVYADIIRTVEEARCTMIQPNKQVILNEIDELRDQWLSGVKTNAKLFSKETNLFCQNVDKYVSVKPKDYADTLDDRMREERHRFLSKAFEYVANIHEAEELKKSKFVQTITVFMKMLSNFYHQAFELMKDSSGKVSLILEAAQRSSENFDQIKLETRTLTEKLLATPCEQIQCINSPDIREGYLFILTKKTVATIWVKTFCSYDRKNKVMQLTTYNQGRDTDCNSESFMVLGCRRRSQDSIDRRCCFDIEVGNKTNPITLQALSLQDLHEWLSILDGKDPIYGPKYEVNDQHEIVLDKRSLKFLLDLIKTIEENDLDTEGIYRKSGVVTQITEIVKLGLSSNGISASNLKQFSIHSLTCALKHFVRHLKEPLMTFDLHDSFVDAVKKQPKNRMKELSMYLHLLPEINREVLTALISHLAKVVSHKDKNSMTASNLGIVFAPSLFRSMHQTVAAIMTTKFTSRAIELMIVNFDQLFPLNSSHTKQTLLAPIKHDRVDDVKRKLSVSSVVGETNKDEADLIQPIYSTTLFDQEATQTCLVHQLHSKPVVFDQTTHLNWFFGEASSVPILNSFKCPTPVQSDRTDNIQLSSENTHGKFKQTSHDTSSSTVQPTKPKRCGMPKSADYEVVKSCPNDRSWMLMSHMKTPPLPPPQSQAQFTHSNSNLPARPSSTSLSSSHANSPQTSLSSIPSVDSTKPSCHSTSYNLIEFDDNPHISVPQSTFK